MTIEPTPFLFEGEHLVRVRKGVEETLASVRFVPLVSDE